MGLRLADGIDRTRFAEATGVDPVMVHWVRPVLAPLLKAGFLKIDATHLGATAGRPPSAHRQLERLIA